MPTPPQLIAALGLDKPLWEQYFVFLKGAVTGDLGKSFVHATSALGLILERMPATMELAIAAMLVSDGALNYFTDHAEVLWQVPVSVAILALYYAAIGVALASLTDRRIVAGVAILGVALVTSVVAAILIETVGDSEGTPLAVLNILALPLEVREPSQVDALFEQYRRAVDVDDQQRVAAEIQRYFAETMLYMTVTGYPILQANRTTVKGYPYMRGMKVLFETTWLEP